MTNLGTVSGTLHQVTEYVDYAYPASGHCGEVSCTVGLLGSTSPEITFNYIPISGGFWVEGVTNDVPSGQLLPVQVAANWFNTSPPAWYVDVVLYADDVYERLGATSYDSFRLHVVAYFIVNDPIEAVDHTSA